MCRISKRMMGVLKTMTEEYFGRTKRKEDMLVLSPKKRNNINIVDKNKLLNPTQLDLLQDAVSLNFNLGGFTSLADILNTIGVEVHIRRGGIELFEESSLAHFFDEAEKYWRERLYHNDQEAKKKIEEIEEERRTRREIDENHTLDDSKHRPRKYILRYRGKYIREKKIIVLYPEVMKSEPDGLKYFEELLVSTLAHEAMHAYFDRPGHNHYPYAYFVEEPMAEFGMLVYLKETAMYGTGKMFSWAENDVLKQRSCYRYGAWLFKQYDSWNPGLRNFLEEFKYSIEKFAMPDIDKGRKTIALPCPILKGFPVAKEIGKKTLTSLPEKSISKGKLCIKLDDGTVIQKEESVDTMRDAIDAAIDAVIGKYNISDILVMSSCWSSPKTKRISKKPLVSNDSEKYVRKRELVHLDADGKPLFIDTNQSNDGKKDILNTIFHDLELDWEAFIEE